MVFVGCSYRCGAEIAAADLVKRNTLRIDFCFFALAVYNSALNGVELQAVNHKSIAVYNDSALDLRHARCQMNDCKSCSQQCKRRYDGEYAFFHIPHPFRISAQASAQRFLR